MGSDIILKSMSKTNVFFCDCNDWSIENYQKRSVRQGERWPSETNDWSIENYQKRSVRQGERWPSETV